MACAYSLCLKPLQWVCTGNLTIKPYLFSFDKCCLLQDGKKYCNVIANFLNATVFFNFPYFLRYFVHKLLILHSNKRGCCHGSKHVADLSNIKKGFSLLSFKKSVIFTIIHLSCAVLLWNKKERESKFCVHFSHHRQVKAQVIRVPLFCDLHN